MTRKNRIKRINRVKRQNHTKEIIQIILAVLGISIVIFTFYNKKSSENYSNIKLDRNQYLVYTKYSDNSSKYIKEVPYINLKADVFKHVNQDIIDFCDDYIKKERGVVTYEYNINGIILSVVVKVINNDTTYAPEPYFRTYNINLKTEEVIADSALLEYFKVTESTVENKIKRTLQSYYSDILKEHYYVNKECSYECFLKHRGINKYLDYTTYYIRDGKLIAFKSFIAHSIFGEEAYFTDDKFEFEIATLPGAEEQEQTE